MITDVNDYFEINMGLDIFDLFRKRRLQEAVDKVDAVRFEKNQVIKKKEELINMQRNSIRVLAQDLTEERAKNEELEKEVAMLKAALNKERKAVTMAESIKYNSTKAVEKLSTENTELRVKLNQALRDYHDLADTHDKLCDDIRSGRAFEELSDTSLYSA